MRFKSFLVTLLVALCLVPFAAAADFNLAEKSGGRGRKLWKISAAILGAVTIADVQSSMGRRELNPMLRNADGRFATRGVSIKAIIVGGALVGQYLMLRKQPEASSWAAGANFAAAAATGVVVSRNHMR